MYLRRNPNRPHLFVKVNEPAPGNKNDEIQELSIDGSTIRLSKGGGSIELPASGPADNLGNHTATQDLNMDSNKVINLADPTNPQDSATKAYVDANSGGSDNLGDHTATQDLDLANNKIINLTDPTLAQDAATKAYVDANTGGSDGVVSNVTFDGTNMNFTGSGGGFNGTVDLSSLGGGTSSPLGYFTDYQEYDIASVASLNSTLGIYPKYTARSMVAQYEGKYNRTYFIYQTNISSQRGVGIYYFDYSTNTFSTPTVTNITRAPDNDTHNTFTLNTDDRGYIYISRQLNDGVTNIWRSDYPEFDNNGAEDLTFTQVGGNLGTYTNYSSLVYSNGVFAVDMRGDELGRAVQESRVIRFSTDYGETWSSPIEYVDFAIGRWVYGGITPDYYRGGFFCLINISDNTTTKSYPIWSVLWTDDFVNFGNLEYYSSNKTSGWSKDVSVAPITEAELVANALGISGTAPEHNFVTDVIQLPNGDLIVTSTEGTRTASSTRNITGYRTSRYDIRLNSWTHNVALVGDLPFSVTTNTTAPNYSIVPYDSLNMKMVVEYNDPGETWGVWITNDGGASWTSDVVIGTYDGQYLHGSIPQHITQDAWVVQQVGTDIKLLRFGEQELYDPIVGKNKEPFFKPSASYPAAGTNVPNGSIFYGDDGAWYVKGGAGTVTQIGGN